MWWLNRTPFLLGKKLAGELGFLGAFCCILSSGLHLGVFTSTSSDIFVVVLDGGSEQVTFIPLIHILEGFFLWSPLHLVLLLGLFLKGLFCHSFLWGFFVLTLLGVSSWEGFFPATLHLLVKNICVRTGWDWHTTVWVFVHLSWGLTMPNHPEDDKQSQCGIFLSTQTLYHPT